MENEHSKKANFLLAVAFALIIGLNVIAVWQIMTLQNIVEKLSETVSVPEVVTEQPKAVVSSAIAPDTSGWKTYRNEEFGFEFRYPTEWYFRTTGDGVVLSPRKEGPAGMDEFSVYVSKDPIRTIKERNEKAYSYSQASIEGKESYISSRVQGFEGYYKEALIDLSPRTIVIEASGITFEILSDILSTFTFIK